MTYEMFRKFYEFLITQKMASIDLFECLETAQKYGKIFSNTNGLFSYVGDDQFALSAPEENGEGHPVFVKADPNREIYCAFYENLMISFSCEDGDKIVRVYAKTPEDEWTFLKPIDGGSFNILSPTNVNAEVYINYDVNVLKLDRCCGEDYRSGSWNKMFFHSILSFIDTVRDYTEVNRVQKAYIKK